MTMAVLRNCSIAPSVDFMTRFQKENHDCIVWLKSENERLQMELDSNKTNSAKEKRA